MITEYSFFTLSEVQNTHTQNKIFDIKLKNKTCQVCEYCFLPMSSDCVSLVLSIFCYNKQVLGPVPELKESTPEEDSQADASNSASLYKVPQLCYVLGLC